MDRKNTRSPFFWVTFGLFAAVTVNASVPHVFKAGEVASASKVNQNFNALDSRISSLEAKSDSATDTTGNNHAHTITTMPPQIHAEIGSRITIGGEEYIIVAMPVVDFKDGSRHIVKYPQRTCTGRSAYCQDGLPPGRAIITSHHLFNNDMPLRINGHKASASMGHSRYIRLASTHVYDSTTQTSTYQDPKLESVVYKDGGSVYLIIGETFVSLPFSTPETVEFENVAVTDTADLSKDFDWDSIDNSEPNKALITKFLQYCEVIDL